MFNLLEMALNNNFVYLAIIIILVIVIILTILSIKKDRDKMLNKAKMNFEPPKNEEEKEKAKLELEKIVDEMQKNIDKKETIKDKITKYEQEQEEDAIISYQDLVEAVKNNGGDSKPRGEVGMEVADTTFIEEPEEFKTAVDKLVEEINKNEEEDITNAEEEIKIEETTEDEIKDTMEDKHIISDNLDDLEKMIENPAQEDDEELDRTIKIPVIEKHASEPKVYEEKNFQSSEFISPIFGTGPQSEMKVKEKKEVSDEELGDTKVVNMDEIIDEKFDDVDDFLDTLKEFRKNL